MRYLVNFNKFILEALKDDLSPHYQKAMKDALDYSHDDNDHYFDDSEYEDLLNNDVPKKADNILEGVWKLSQEDKDIAINSMFRLDIPQVKSILNSFNISDHFLEILKLSLIQDKDLNVKKPSIHDIKIIYENNFKLLNVTETKSDFLIVKDERGMPIKNDEGKFVKKDKNIGEPVFSKNISNLNGFIISYQQAYGIYFINPYASSDLKVSYDILKSISDEFDINLFDKFDLELYISSHPEDMLNMSISAFYDSCQNLYNGSYKQNLPSNVFDPNVKICYLRFNTPFTNYKGNVIPYTAFSRCLIRNIKGKTYFDKVYPPDSFLQKFQHDMITKYTGMSNNSVGKYYYYKHGNIKSPYMDTLSIETVGMEYSNKYTQTLSKVLDIPLQEWTQVSNNKYYYFDDNGVKVYYYIYDIANKNDIERIHNELLNQIRWYPFSCFNSSDILKHVNFDNFLRKSGEIVYNYIQYKGKNPKNWEDLLTFYKDKQSYLGYYIGHCIDRSFLDQILLNWKKYIADILAIDKKEIIYEDYIILLSK